MGNRVSIYALETGRTLVRNLTPTPEGLAALREHDAKEEAEAARKRAVLLELARRELIGRVFQC